MTPAANLTAVSPSAQPVTAGREHAFWRILDSGNLWSIAVRRPKSSLSASAVTCLRGLRSVIGSNQISPLHLIPVYNNSALLFHHNGRLLQATQLTFDALSLCSEGWKRTGNLAWGACMLQPYINLGRIAYAKGDFTAARTFFDNLYQYVWEGKALQIGDSCFTADLLDGFRDLKEELVDPSLDSFAFFVYLAEGAKTLLGGGEFERLLDFTVRVANQHGIPISGAEAVNAIPSLPSLTAAPLSADQRAAATLIILELRARAFAGLGDNNKALETYANIVKRLPRGRPGMLGVYASAAELLQKEGRANDARKLVEYSAGLLKTFASGPTVALDHYQVNFALALRHSSLGDLKKTEVFAEAALHFARSCDHQTGMLRAQVLLLLSRCCDKASEHSFSHDVDERIRECLERLDECLYPLERACVLLELAAGPGYSFVNAEALKHAALEIFRELKLQGGCVSKELEKKAGIAWNGGGRAVAGPSIDPAMEQLYRSLREYASAAGDGHFRMPEIQQMLALIRP